MKIPQSKIRLLTGRLVNLIKQRGIYNDSLTHKMQKLKQLQKLLWYLESMSEVKRIMQELLITEESSILRNHSSLVMMRPDS